MIRRVVASFAVTGAVLGGASIGASSCDNGTPAADGARQEAGGSAPDAARGGDEGSPDAGCAANLESDPHDCGQCGHDCAGASCQGGLCQPSVVVSLPRPGTVSAFAVDSTSVYWTNESTGLDGGTLLANGFVSKCALAGCDGGIANLATGQAVPEGIWVFGSTVYWDDTNTGAIMQCATDCADDATTFFKLPSLGPVGFAASATEGFVAYQGTVEACALGGCDAASPVATGQSTADDVVVSGSSLYWIDQGTLVGGKAVQLVDGGVMACSLPDCDGGPVTIASNLSYPSDLAVSGSTAYWAQGSAVMSCSIHGCGTAPTPLASLQAGEDIVDGLATDGTNVYFGVAHETGARAWGLFKCAVTGCPGGATLLASMPTSGNPPTAGVAVDATRVYFVSSDGTQILSVAK